MKDSGFMDISTPFGGQRHTDSFSHILVLTLKIQNIRFITETTEMLKTSVGIKPSFSLTESNSGEN